MGTKYGGYGSERKSSKREEQKVHPVWRGVGFVFMILIPIMSYASMQVILTQNYRHGWVPLTPDMMAVEGQLLYSIIPDPLLYVKLVIFLLCLMVFFAIFTLISFYITAMFGINAKNDPFYVPPVRRTTPRSRRR
jgi:hypothetical protein